MKFDYKGQNPYDRLKIDEFDDGPDSEVVDSSINTLDDFIQANGDPELGKDILALSKGKKMEIGGGASPYFEITRLDFTPPIKAKKDKPVKVAANSRKANLTDYDTFSQLVSMAADDAEIDSNTPEYRKALKVATVFENEVEKGLNLWVPKHLDVFDPRLGGADDVVETLMNARNNEAPFLYFMELEGHGVGTTDGDWDKYFTDDRAIEELSKFMEKHLSRIYSQLQSAIYEAADASRLDRDEDDDGGRYASRGGRFASRRLRRSGY